MANTSTSKTINNNNSTHKCNSRLDSLRMAQAHGMQATAALSMAGRTKSHIETLTVFYPLH